MIQKTVQTQHSTVLGVLLKILHLKLKFFRIQQVIPIEELDQLSARLLEARITSSGNALIGLRNQPEASIPLNECADHAGGFIEGTIIDDDAFKALKSLSSDTLQSLRNQPCLIETGDDDGNKGWWWCGSRHDSAAPVFARA